MTSYRRGKSAASMAMDRARAPLATETNGHDNREDLLCLNDHKDHEENMIDDDAY